jgi:signal transduction histidine kinase
MVRMMGFEGNKEEYLGTCCGDYHVYPEKMAQFRDILCVGGALRDKTIQVRRRDGTVMDLLVNTNAKFDSNGNLSHTRCIIMDMTESNRLRRERDEMEKLRQEAELKEQLALTASKTKSDFLAVMSHEICTPINGVIGAASLLTDTLFDEEQVGYLKIIKDSADILLSLIQNILDISKIEQGKMDLDVTSLRVTNSIDKCCSIMQSRAEDKGVALISTIDPIFDLENIWHFCDDTRLNQVILNFLSNAIKFTHKGSVECKLSIETSIVVDDEEPGTEFNCCRDIVLLEVNDSGVGIEDTSKLFSDFVQASKHVYQEYGGTGLGLSVSRKLIELMGGTVGIRSVVNVGTTVWATFPLQRAQAPCSTLTTSRMGELHHVDSGSTDINILVAEDNKVNQKLLKRMLETLEYFSVKVVGNGREAVDAVTAMLSEEKCHTSPQKYDIILMVRMLMCAIVCVCFNVVFCCISGLFDACHERIGGYC